MNIKLNEQIKLVETSKIRQFNDYAQSVGANLILTLGQPDFNTPDSVKKACINSLNQNMTKYGPTPGLLSTRKAVCEFEKRKNNLDYVPDEVIITHGSTEALTAAIFTMTNPGDEFIVPIPAYPMYRQIINFAKGKVVTIDTTANNFQISKETLDKAITSKTKAIIITSPNNPTGAILDDQSLANIYNAIKNKPIYLISDDVYNQIIYTKASFMCKYKDLKPQMIICQSLSKPYAMPGWRCGYMLAPMNFITEALKIHQYMLVGENTFIQPAMEEALLFDPKEMIESYKIRRDYVCNRLINMGLILNIPEGAFYVFPSIKKFGIDSWTFCKMLALKYKVAIIPGICFEADDYIRISYCVDMDTIKKALDALESFIKEL